MALDTSVLVAALTRAHPHHARARWWLDGPKQARVASFHAYAETWATLTAMPLEPRVTGEVAQTVLERLRSTVRFVAPRTRTYVEAAKRCAGRGVRSGAIYDALHLITAEQESADVFATFNERDFARLAEPDGPRIVVPPDPPGFPS
jgi:predicted nucleic acid-binding protein